MMSGGSPVGKRGASGRNRGDDPTDAGGSPAGGPTLVVPPAVMDAIGRHLEAAFPAEGCGVLLGEAEGDVRRVRRQVAADNRVSDRNDRYEVDPAVLRELLEAEDRGGPRVVGFYHSHPDAAPEPSSTDRGLAWPWYAYLIVPVRDGRAGRGRVWSFDGEESTPVEGRLREAGDGPAGAHAGDDRPPGGG
jgi:proteasome lid subunit RPN8/RPN11